VNAGAFEIYPQLTRPDACPPDKSLISLILRVSFRYTY